MPPIVAIAPIKSILSVFFHACFSRSSEEPEMYFPHDIYINVSGIKEWLNQPHRHYAEKNEALLHLTELLLESEYLGAKPDPKGRDYIRNGHIFKTTIAEESSWIIISETIWGDCFVHSISDDYPYINEKQDF